MQAGVDEAGKGPVLGSMFAAAVRADPEELPDGVADSKQLTADRRQELAALIRDCADAVAVAEITVDRIDDPATDMNGLTVEAQAAALGDVLTDGLASYADACDTNAVRFEHRLQDRLSGTVDLHAEHGADETYRVVSAASIVAKVERDAHVDALAEEYGALGSGYPSDERTREFLATFVERNGRLPACARESWQTSQDVLASRGQASLDEF